MSKIVIIGGTGILGSELFRIDKNLILLNSFYDVYDFSKLEKFLDILNPDVIVNCVSIKSEKVDEDLEKSININIIGAANISKYCLKFNKRLIYISTDYVYDGKYGDYTEDNPILPCNNYAWSKLAGEISSRFVKNHLIIRTSFCKSDFKYETSYVNHFTSKDYVDIVAPKILNLIKTDLIGIINVGTDRKSSFDLISSRSITIPNSCYESKDFSMNLKKLNEYEEKL